VPSKLGKEAALAAEATATTVSRSTAIHPERRGNHGRAALQRRVTGSKSIRALALAPCPRLTVNFCEPTMNFTCGKPTPSPRIKPVIAGDTTYGVSLLTGTISGSNFAIP
jgi:hypothetical protein